MIFKAIKKSPKLLQFLKVFGISIVGIFGFLYLAFLLILPNVINLNKFMPMIKEEMAKITPLKLDVKNPKLKTNFKLGLGIVADNINLKYLTGENFVNIDNMSSFQPKSSSQLNQTTNIEFDKESRVITTNKLKVIGANLGK